MSMLSVFRSRRFGASSSFISLAIQAAAVAAIVAAAPAHAVTSLVLDTPGCSAGGSLTWNAAGKMLYCAGGTSPSNTLGIIVPGCAAGFAFAINPQTMSGTCLASAGAPAAASLPITVSLPDCVAGQVSWNASTKTLTCRRAGQVLNVDASTSSVYDSLTDGLVIMRYLFGIRGAPLVANAVAPTATRTDPVAIAAYLDSVRASLDIDGNGAVDALTDGTLIMRYMFGQRGAALVVGAVGSGALNATPVAVEAKIQALMP